jgi:hypothetical protein
LPGTVVVVVVVVVVAGVVVVARFACPRAVGDFPWTGVVAVFV